jgi:hypothetical protein
LDGAHTTKFDIFDAEGGAHAIKLGDFDAEGGADTTKLNTTYPTSSAYKL